MASFSTLAILSLQLLLFASATVISAQETTTSLPPAEPPTHYKHHRPHKHHNHPPAYPPTLPPHKPPVPPPTKPPVKPPVHAPVKPPAHPPVTPPAHPPVKPPAHPPVKPPAYPPVKPPAHPPVKPPAHPPTKPPQPPVVRSFIEVEGVVYCKPTCQYAGIDTLLGAAPLPGATVKLTCNNTRAAAEVTGTTDGHGYFLVKAPKTITSFGVRSCRVMLVSSPSPKCPVASDLHRGATGSRIRPEKPYLDPLKSPTILFAAGPFAFEPKCKI